MLLIIRTRRYNNNNSCCCQQSTFSHSSRRPAIVVVLLLGYICCLLLPVLFVPKKGDSSSFLFVTSQPTPPTPTTTSNITCPPPSFDALRSLDLNGFIGGTSTNNNIRWYALKQLPVFFQPINQFYCVTAQYTPITSPSVYCQLFNCIDPPSIKVFNVARRKSVKGFPFFVYFEASFTDVSNEPAKALIGLPFIPPRPLRTGNNYWVVAAGKFENLSGAFNKTIVPSKEIYDYAIITASTPKKVGSNGCYSGPGMWMFSRVPQPPNGVIDAIDNIAKNLGLATENWLPVQHEGCNYI